MTLTMMKNYLTDSMAEALRACTRNALKRCADWEYRIIGNPGEHTTETYRLEDCGYILLDHAGGTAPTRSGVLALTRYSKMLEEPRNQGVVPVADGIPHTMLVAGRGR